MLLSSVMLSFFTLFAGVFLAEISVNVELNEIYRKLKTSLNKNKCKIITEEPQKKFGHSRFSLGDICRDRPEKDTIPASSGCPRNLYRQHFKLDQWLHQFDFVRRCFVNLAGVFLRLDSLGFADLFFKMGVQGFWGWLAQIHGRIDLDVAALFIRLVGSWRLSFLLLWWLRVSLLPEFAQG